MLTYSQSETIFPSQILKMSVTIIVKDVPILMPMRKSAQEGGGCLWTLLLEAAHPEERRPKQSHPGRGTQV